MQWIRRGECNPVDPAGLCLVLLGGGGGEVNCTPPPRGILGAFSHSAGTSRAQCQSLRCLSREHPCKPPPYRSVHDPFQTALGVQNSGPWDPWLPVVKNSRLFAQRGHSARCAPFGRPTHPHQKIFPRGRNEIQGARTWRSIFGTQTFFGLCPSPPPPPSGMVSTSH